MTAARMLKTAHLERGGKIPAGTLCAGCKLEVTGSWVEAREEAASVGPLTSLVKRYYHYSCWLKK